MVRMENIKRDGKYVTFDGYIEGKRDDHFTMKVDLTDNGKTECSIESNYCTQMAALKIFRLVVRNKELPSEYTYIWH